MSDLIFLRPLWLLGALLSVVFLLFTNRRKQLKSSWWQVMDDAFARTLIISEGSHRLMTPINLLLVLLATICIALAGPSIDKRVPDDIKGRASIVVLLANSDSMYAGDVTPNRNRVAKQKIYTLIHMMPESQVGLIAYSDSAHQVSPLTSDPNFLSLYLNPLEPNLMPDRHQKKTAIKDALEQAEQLFEQAEYPANLILMADNLTTQDVEDIVTYQTESGVAIEVLAMGTTKGGQLRFVGGNAVNNDVDTKMDLAPFSSLKSRGIPMLGVTQNSDDIEWLSTEIKRAVAEKHKFNPDFVWQDSGYLLAWVFIPVCLMLFRRQSWVFSFSPMVMPVLLGLSLSVVNPVQAETVTMDSRQYEVTVWDELWWSGDQLGQKAVNMGDYHQAAKRFEDPLLKGWAFYQLGEYAEAETQFRGVDSAQGYFYLANSLAMQEKYKTALTAYGQAIAKKDNFSEAKYNAELVKQQLALTNKLSANERRVSDEGQAILQVGVKGKANKKEHIHIDPLKYSAEELNLWLEKVKSSPDKLLKTKFELQSQEKMIDAL
ncbi:VWA domain-containing protein [uncultured Vibrio sp.]|uniref:vWA domain-containing protein n=1 Tax=uncultured Vibrio sp. TaxID=114054 RepID=UPI0025F6CCF2|nr:VWA domain-containing protein [uncultured Vibrio sp.]